MAFGSLIEADTAHFHHHSKGGQHETDDEGEAEDDELQQHQQRSARHESPATPAQAHTTCKQPHDLAKGDLLVPWSVIQRGRLHGRRQARRLNKGLCCTAGP